MRGLSRVLAGRVLSVACAMAVVLGAGACSDRGSGAPEQASSGADVSSSAVVTPSGGRLAASMGDYLDSINASAQSDPHVSDAQKQILARSAANGSVSAADYEAAWNNYKTCMTDRGYSEPVLVKYPNGVYQLAGQSRVGGTEEQMEKLDKDSPECWDLEVTDVNGAYSLQIGNPSLSTDTDAAIVDCLHKTGKVPASYTTAQWLKESNDFSHDTVSEQYSIDIKDPQIRGCLVANGNVFTDFNDPNEIIWYPFRK